MEDKTKPALGETGNFIHEFIRNDLNGETSKVVTRFPPEPNGYLHIGHAKAFCLNFGIAEMYGGKYNLRFDDTNPIKEDIEYVNSIIEDIEWLGFDVSGRILYASDYFERMFECAVELIKKDKAFVCDLTADEIREYRGSLSSPGKESPYRNRSVKENLDLFYRMRSGEFQDGEKTLRAKIDMRSSNINMRDPVIYRIARAAHHNTGDKWCIYPMYDYAHPLEDAFEKVTHSMCSLEFEDHRPLYDWFIKELDFEVKPRQIEFAKLLITNTVMGKRYLRQLVENNEVMGWDDPRMVTLCGLRRRGYTPESIREFLDKTGVSKANSKVDIAFLEHCLKENIKKKAKVVMAVLDPIKVVITNYPENKTEMLEIENNQENEELGARLVPFSSELYIEREDFMEDAPSKFFRLTVGREVRLKGAYFILCNEVIKDEKGNLLQLNCTYDETTKSGSGFDGRKVKGTIHWVSAPHAVLVEARIFDTLVIDDDSEAGYHKNPESIKIIKNVYAEPSIKEAIQSDRFQFLRTGYFCLDEKDSMQDKLVFNRICPIKSSFKLN